MNSININFFKNHLNKKNKFHIIFLTILNFFSIVVELLTITTLIPLIIVILRGDVNEINLGFLNDLKIEYAKFLVFENLKIILFVTFSLFLFKSFFFVFVTYFNAWLQGSLTSTVSNKIFKSYICNSYINSKFKNSSELINDCTSVSEDFVKNYFMGSILATKSFLSLLFILILLLTLYTKIILIVVSTLVLVFITFNLVVKNILIKFGKTKVKVNQSFIKLIKESVGALKEIKLYKLENKFADIHFNKKFQHERIKRLEKVIANLPKSFSELIIIIFVMLTLIFNENLEKDMVSSALMISILGYSSLRMMPQVLFLVKFMNKLNYTKFSAEKIMKDLNDFSNNDKISTLKKYGDNKKNFYLKKEIKLKNISFKYENNNEKVFNKLNLKIKKGQIIGITGESGSGKTTLINIILGLINFNEGKMLIDERKFEVIKHNWQKKISIVPQDAFFFDDTVLENIKLNSKDVDSEILEKSIFDSQSKEFIEKLPNKIKTVIGEDGKSLSTGQKQRLAIARALYKNPDLIILDEATSSLDDQNEEMIIRTIEKLKGDKTIIFVTHRKKPLKICDIIYKIENKQLKVLN